jgi:hypothetical protein
VLDDADELLHFVETDMQRLIMEYLHGCAMTADELCGALNCARETLFGKKNRAGQSRGGLNELVAIGRVQNDRKVGGYFRPDAPPETRKAN